MPGSYPFDALAALYVLHPQQFSCAKVSAWIAEDDRQTLPWRIALGSTGLLVGLEADRPQIARASGSVTYCGGVGDGFKDLLMDLLIRQGGRGDLPHRERRRPGDRVGGPDARCDVVIVMIGMSGCDQ